MSDAMMRVPRKLIPFLLVGLLAPCSAFVVAQSGQTKTKAPPKEPPGIEEEPEPAETEPGFNPYRAAKDLEVGKWYLKTGKVDAAILRFQSALQFKPNFAAPHFYLGRALEKKQDLPAALREYQKYLEILSNGEEAKEARKRIAALEKKLREKSAKSK